MIGRQPLPDAYVEWNQRWGAPYGQTTGPAATHRERFTRPTAELGPFAYQPAGDLQTFEYPWAYFAAEAGAGHRLLAVDGGTGGLQFVLAREGCRVVNVGSGCERQGSSAERGYAASMPHLHQRLNAVFDTDVRLVREPLEQADIPEASFDRAMCLSMLERLDPDEGARLMRRVAALLAPGGLLLVTAGLYFDLKPFGVRERNGHGTNVDLHQLVDGLGLELTQGDPRELNGFAEFDPHRVVARAGELFVSSSYPRVIQTMVLRRPGT